MIERIIYENVIYYYIGMSNGEYVYRQLNSNYYVRFTPGMFDIMKAAGIIKAVIDVDTDSIKYIEEV